MFTQVKGLIIPILAITFLFQFSNAVWEVQTIEQGRSAGEGGLSFKIDKEGKPHIVYYDDADENLLYASLGEDGKFKIEIVDRKGAVGKDCKLSLGQNQDTLSIVYKDWSNSQLKYAYYLGYLDKWEVFKIEPEISLHYQFSFVFKQRFLDGHIGLIENNAIKYVYLKLTPFAGVNVEKVEKVDEVSSFFGAYLSLDVDTSGWVHLCYYDPGEGDLKYASSFYGDDDWKVEEVDVKGRVGEYCYLKLDSKGNPHIIYYDLSNYGEDKIKYATKQKFSSEWQIEVIDKVHSGYPCFLDFSKDNTPYVAYAIEGGGGYYLVLAQKKGNEWSITLTELKVKVWVDEVILDFALQDNTPMIAYHPPEGGLKLAKWVGNSAPTPFNLISPENEKELSLDDFPLAFKWEKSYDPEGSKIVYTLYLSTSPSAEGGEVFSNITEHHDYWGYEVLLEYKPNTTYYWKIKAVDETGLETFSNQIWSFTTPSLSISSSPRIFYTHLDFPNPLLNSKQFLIRKFILSSSVKDVKIYNILGQLLKDVDKKCGVFFYQFQRKNENIPYIKRYLIIK